MQLKADLHIHTSEDKLDSFIKYSAKDIINKAKRLNFKVLAITNHRDVFYNKETADYAKKIGILLIPAVEIKIKGKEVLIYNITDKEAHSIKTFDDIRNLKKKKNILVIAPHPFFALPQCLGKLLIKNIDCFDSIEISRLYTALINPNKKAKKTALRYKKSLIANSDSHLGYHFGKNYSLIGSKQEINQIIKAIKDNKIRSVSRPLDFFTFIKEASFSIISKLYKSQSKKLINK